MKDHQSDKFKYVFNNISEFFVVFADMVDNGEIDTESQSYNKLHCIAVKIYNTLTDMQKANTSVN